VSKDYVVCAGVEDNETTRKRAIHSCASYVDRRVLAGISRTVAVQEAAGIFNVAVSTVRRWIRQAKGRHGMYCLECKRLWRDCDCLGIDNAAR
jgi:hypothetical protein